MKLLGPGAIGFGFALLLLSTVWLQIFPPTSSWTREKEEHWQDVKRRLHNLSFVVGGPQRVRMHSGPDTGQAKAEFDALTKENEQLAAEFATANDRPNLISKVLKWTGISLAIVGIIGWYAAKNLES